MYMGAQLQHTAMEYFKLPTSKSCFEDVLKS